MSKVIKIMLFFIFLLITVQSAIAVPPVTVLQQFTTGYVIEHSPQIYIEQNQDYTINFFIRNITNGVLIDNSTTNCSFYMASSTGTLAHNTNVIYSSGYWHTLISGGNFSSTGIYPYGIACNGIGLGGKKVFAFEVTKTGTDETKEFTALMNIALIIALGVLVFLFFYFAFSLDESHFILKILLMFFALIFIILIPATLINGYVNTSPILNKVVISFFGLFVIYFSIFIFWHWCQKSEKMLEMISNVRGTFSKR